MTGSSVTRPRLRKGTSFSGDLYKRVLAVSGSVGGAQLQRMSAPPGLRARKGLATRGGVRFGVRMTSWMSSDVQVVSVEQRVLRT